MKNQIYDTQYIKQNISFYAFHQLVELLNKLSFIENHHDLIDISATKENIRFEASANIAFPKSDLQFFEKDADGKFKLHVNFLGLQGSQSPLPNYYLDDLAWDETQGFSSLSKFLNIFNHRMLIFFHKNWQKYRYYINFREDGKDEFSQRIFSLLGLGDILSQHKIPIKQSKMLAYAGLLSNPGRSPTVISSLIEHGFDLDFVKVINWRLRDVTIPCDQRNKITNKKLSLSARNSLDHIEGTILGQNFFLGSTLKDRSGKFLLSITNLKLERFLNFLPNGKEFLSLVTFVSFILREPLSWDIELGLDSKQAQCLKLGDSVHSQLGWTTYLGQPEDKPSITLPVLD